MLSSYQANRIARRISLRVFLRREAAGRPIPEGTKVETPYLRVQRFRNAIRVWDLANAGRRGKNVPSFAVYDLDYLDEDKMPLVDAFSAQLRSLDYTKAVKAAHAFLARLGGNMARKIQFSEEKGVRVDPAGQAPVKIRGRHIDVNIEPQSFWVRDLRNKATEPTLIPRNRKVTSTKRLYAWALDNKAKIKGMTFKQMEEQMVTLKVDYHYYLAVD